MRGEMNSYRFEISNRRENKFCSHEVSFRLHFKTTRYFDGHVQAFHFGQCLHDILSPEMKFHFCQNDRYEIDTRIEFQMHMRIKHNIQRVCGYIHCVSGKLCSHENLMHRNKELRNTEHQNTGRTPTEQQNSGRTIGIPWDS